MPSLLDVNVLVALCDEEHLHHRRCLAWWRDHHNAGWATCPLTENGLIRILGHPNYPDGPGSTALAASALSLFRQIPGHRFVPDDISIFDRNSLPSLDNVTAGNLTDLYLLALAIHHELNFVTLDARINATLLPSGPEHYHVVAPAQ